MNFQGSGVALVTPFNKDNVYEVNYDKLRELINFHIENSTDAIVISGTTGESATLTESEKIKVLECAIKAANKKIPIIAGTGSNDTRHAIELSKSAESLGADGLLIVTPYYNKCTQQGLIEHYTKIANNVNIPIILYNVPSRTGVNILPETVAKLAEVKNIIGIKEASGNLEQVAQIIKLSRKINPDFAIYSGNDDQIYEILNLGGNGVISVLANIRPKETHQICDEYFNGNKETSKALQEKYQPLIKSLFSEVNPIPVKTALILEGYEVGEPRLPLTPLTKENITILKKELEKTK